MADAVSRSPGEAMRIEKSASIPIVSPRMAGRKADQRPGALNAEWGLERGKRGEALDIRSVLIERLLSWNGGERVDADDVQDGEAEIVGIDGVQTGCGGVPFVDIAPESGLIAERITGESFGFGASLLLRKNPAEAERGDRHAVAAMKHLSRALIDHLRQAVGILDFERVIFIDRHVAGRIRRRRRTAGRHR